MLYKSALYWANNHVQGMIHVNSLGVKIFALKMKRAKREGAL